MGFSFGARVGIALAAHHPELIHRMSLTGVPLVRPALGTLIINSWAQLLAQNNTKECAYSFLINGYSPAFIERHHAKFPDYVDMIVSSNDPQRLFDLITKSHPTPISTIAEDHLVTEKRDEEGAGEGVEDVYGTPYCTGRIRCHTQVIGSRLDRIAGFEAVEEVARRIPVGRGVFQEMTEVGHLMPFEKPGEWRRLVLSFLSQS